MAMAGSRASVGRMKAKCNFLKLILSWRNFSRARRAFGGSYFPRRISQQSSESNGPATQQPQRSGGSSPSLGTNDQCAEGMTREVRLGLQQTDATRD